MRRLTLLDTDVLYRVIDPVEFPYGISSVIEKLKTNYIYVFASEDNDAIVVYEPVYGDIPWVNTHTWTLPLGRGKKLKDFYLETGMWIFNNTPYITITSVIPKSLRTQGLFLRACGAERTGTVGDYVIYTFNKSDSLSRKEDYK